MSRIGRLPVTIPSGVQVDIDGRQVTVQGPKGTLTHTVADPIDVRREDGVVKVTRPNDDGPVRAETRTAVLALLSEHLQRSLTEAEERSETRLDQLGMDSLDRMNVSLEVERRFGFSGEEG